MVRAILLAAALSLPAGTAFSAAVEIDMSPNEPASFGLRNVAAGATAIFGGWNYWYKERTVEIETVPAEARLQLFFIRSNFQKRYEEVEAPIRVRLPSRIETTKKDSFALRVAANGYSTKELSIKVNEVPDQLVVKLAPLPNSLVSLTETHLANRTTLTLRTTKEPELRILKSRGVSGFTLSLSETADQLPEGSNVSGGWLDAVEVAQVGEDLLLSLSTSDPKVEARSKKSFDPVRREHVFTLDLMPKGQRAPGSQQIRSELERVSFSRDDTCALAFEKTLRDGFDPEVLARGIRPSGSIADLYRREAMLKLGRLDQGRVEKVDGEVLRTGSPIELELALQSGAQVHGYLALLGAIADGEPDPALAMRSLIAPAMSPDEFNPVYERADAARRACR